MGNARSNWGQSRAQQTLVLPSVVLGAPSDTASDTALGTLVEILGRLFHPVFRPNLHPYLGPIFQSGPVLFLATAVDLGLDHGLAVGLDLDPGPG